MFKSKFSKYLLGVKKAWKYFSTSFFVQSNTNGKNPELSKTTPDLILKLNFNYAPILKVAMPADLTRAVA
jgi:hypothetical protein